MPKRMSIFGVGPVVILITVAYFLAALAMHLHYPGRFAVRGVPYACFAAAGSILLAVGLPTLVLAVRAVRRAYRKGRLVAEGPYALCRHPAYAAELVCVAGVALLFQSWLMLTVPVAHYVAIRILVRKEEDYLARTFGQEFLDYRRKVNALFPTWRR
jgi:protein-S-isoprenylcysteine O-methyltransferase Ste14